MDKDKEEQLDATIIAGSNRRENIPEEIKGKSNWLYFNDRPISLNRYDLLWHHDDLIRRQLDEIAQQLVEPLESDRHGPGMTFAVLGDWGAGKSSFLKMLEDEAKGLAGDRRERIKFCTYIASAYASLGVDVRLTLGIQVLRALEGSDARVLETYTQLTEEQIRASGREALISLGVNEALQEIASRVTGLIEFPAHLAGLLRGIDTSDYKPRILVIMIDDLDRCPLNTVESILKTTQQWAEIDNLFFVLAINKEWLSKAIQTLGGLEAESDYALEKYVQHSVTLPTLDGERLETYVKELLRPYEDAVSRSIADNVIYLQKGLRIKTPRAVKRLLNSIRPDLQATLEAKESNVDVRLIIKESVLRYSWPDFYQNYFSRSVKGSTRTSFNKAWEQLETACRAYEIEARRYQQDPDDEKLAFSMERIRAQYRDDNFMRPIAPALVYFLAEEPYWFYKPSPGIEEDYAASIPSKPADTEFEFEVGAISPEEDIDTRFMQLYYLGRAQDDRKRELELYAEAAQLAADNSDRIPNHRADEIGNMALSAENYRANDLANALFSFALSLNPNHPNNMQNYISFIQDTQRQDLYGLVDDFLAVLESRYPEFKPERTLRFKAKSAELKGEQIQLTPEKISEIVAKVEKSPQDWDVYGQAMLIAHDVVKDYDLMRRVLEITCQPQLVNSKIYIYRRVRAFADSLSAHREWRNRRFEAMEIYRRFLADLEFIEKDDEADILHNYATLLFAFDYDDEAGRMWYRAYQLRPHDTSIRRAYSSYLGQAGHANLVAKVLEGQPVEEMILWPVKEAMPPHFSDEPYIGQLFELMSQQVNNKG